jgi:hypothetical protein
MFIEARNEPPRFLITLTDSSEGNLMRCTPSEAAFETIARDAPVTADGRPDRSADTNMRLSCGLQRLYEPITDEQPDRLRYLLMLLDRHLAGDRK